MNRANFERAVEVVFDDLEHELLFVSIDPVRIKLEPGDEFRGLLLGSGDGGQAADLRRQVAGDYFDLAAKASEASLRRFFPNLKAARLAEPEYAQKVLRGLKAHLKKRILGVNTPTGAAHHPKAHRLGKGRHDLKPVKMMRGRSR